jgi:alanine racemase
VGYSGAFLAPAAMAVGIVTCGYADGYPRHAPTGTPVVVDGVRTRLLGRVSMDMMAVDLGPVPHACIGAPVTLWGASDLAVEEVAASAGTIAAELLTGLSARVPVQLAGRDPGP